MVRFKTILVPVDFFKASSRAFDYSLKLATNYGARLHLLHVVAPVISSAYGAPFSVEDLTADIEKEAKRLLERLKVRASKAGISATTEVRLGDIDLGILHSVKNHRADLVVMGTHGRRGFERLVLGSVTERMVRHCPVPLFTIGAAKKHGAAPPKIRRILVTTDFSAGTPDAVNYALSIAQECQAKVTLLHVVQDLAPEVAANYRMSLVRGIEEQLQKLVPEEALDWCDLETRVVEGHPSTVIAAAVKSGSFDLLVMNIHGKSLLDRALVGSTAERALRAAAETCPVLLIPPLKGSGRKRVAAS